MENQNNNNARRNRFNFSIARPGTPVVPPENVKPTRSRKPPKDDKDGPLIFNVASLLHEVEGSHREYDFEQERLPLAPEGEKPAEATNIAGHVRLTKVRHDVLAQGGGEADVVLECVRCLNDFDYHVTFELEEVYRPSIDVLTGQPVSVESPEDEADLKLDGNHLLNLGEAIRQQILVSLPINPICREDCPGLTDVLRRVNEGSLEHHHQPAETTPEETEEEGDEPVDPRWSALSQLLKKDE